MADRPSDAARPGPGDASEWLRARIGAVVLRELGQPSAFQAVQVRPLWTGRYRVNVLVGGSAASATVAHSYFLEADAEGNVITATPALTRRY